MKPKYENDIFKTIEKEIKEVLLPYFEETKQYCTRCPHTWEDHTYGGKKEACQVANCICLSQTFFDKVVSEGDTPFIVEEILEIIKANIRPNA